MTWTARDLNELIDRYADAVGQGNFKEAHRLLLLAEGAKACLPDVTGADGAAVNWGRVDIEPLLEHLRSLADEPEPRDKGKPTEHGWSGDDDDAGWLPVILVTA